MKIYRYFFNWNIDVPKSHDILLKTTDRLKPVFGKFNV